MCYGGLVVVWTYISRSPNPMGSTSRRPSPTRFLSVKAVKEGFETSENTWKVGGRLGRGWSGEKERMTHLLIRCQSTAIIPSSPAIIMVLPHFH